MLCAKDIIDGFFEKTKRQPRDGKKDQANRKLNGERR